MRLSFIINSLTTGGAERQFSQLVEHLSNHHKTRLYLLEQDQEVSIKKKPVVLSRISQRTPTSLRAIGHLFTYRKLRRALKGFQPAISVSSLEVANICNILAARRGGWKSIINIGCYLSNQYRKGLYGLLFRKAIKILYPKADLIIVNSSVAAEDLVTNFKVQKAKVVVLHNWLDLTRIKELAKKRVRKEDLSLFGKPTIISVGRLTEAKGYEYLIESFATVVQQKKGARLIIVGEGEKRPLLEQRIAELGLEKSVFLIGRRENPFALVARADLFVMSSKWEGFPNALLEALAVGTPVLAADCKSGPREILAPRTQAEARALERAKYGFLTPPVTAQQPNLFAKNILKCLDDQQGLRDFQKRGPQRARMFSKQQQLKEFDRILDTIAKSL